MTAAMYGDLQLGGKTFRLQFALMAFQSLAEIWNCTSIDDVVAQVNTIKGTLAAGPKLADVIWAGTRRFNPEANRDEIFLALEDDGLAVFPKTMQRTFEILMAQYPQDLKGVGAEKKTAPKKKRFRP